MRLGLAITCLLLLNGCAGALAAAQTDLDDVLHGLSAVCPADKQSDACAAARSGYVAANDAYELALLADKTGKDAQPMLAQFAGAVKVAWADIKAVFH